MYNKVYNVVLIEDLGILPLSDYDIASPNRPPTELVNSDLQREKRCSDVDLATIKLL